jgi:hypothetical protein
MMPVYYKVHWTQVKPTGASSHSTSNSTPGSKSASPQPKPPCLAWFPCAWLVFRAPLEGGLSRITKACLFRLARGKNQNVKRIGLFNPKYCPKESSKHYQGFLIYKVAFWLASSYIFFGELARLKTNRQLKEGNISP